MARIVMMLNRLVIGGAPLDTVQLAGWLASHHDVYLIAGEKNPDELDAGFLMEDYPALKMRYITGMKRQPSFFKDIRAFFQIRRFIKEIAPDIVHTHGAKTGLLGRMAAASCGVRVIIHTYHGHVFHSYFNRFISALIIYTERLLARVTTKIIAISQIQENELRLRYKIGSQKKLAIVKLGIETDKFIDPDQQLRKTFRSFYGIAEHEIAIGVIGRIVPVKGHGFYLEVIAELQKRRVAGLRFFIIGDGALRKELQLSCEAKRIDAVFYPEEKRNALLCFSSWILHIEEAMAGLDIIALTSLNEGTPVTLLEAQAAARPVVATRVGAVEEVVLDRVSGFVLPYNEVGQFADRIMQLADNEELRMNMGEAGRAFMKSQHQKNQQFEAIEKLYANLLDA